MRNYKLDKKYLIGSKRISKGAQKKYFRDGYYYKVNNNGNEGLTEYLVYTGKFRMAPLFDNGNSLDTDRTGNNASCMIGGSFEQQVLAFGFPVKASFKIYYSSLKKDIDRIENMYGRKHEIDVLNIQLRAYEDLFRLR